MERSRCWKLMFKNISHSDIMMSLKRVHTLLVMFRIKAFFGFFCLHVLSHIFDGPFPLR